jgi:hypothetical protein
VPALDRRSVRTDSQQSPRRHEPDLVQRHLATPRRDPANRQIEREHVQLRLGADQRTERKRSRPPEHTAFDLNVEDSNEPGRVAEHDRFGLFIGRDCPGPAMDNGDVCPMRHKQV